MSAAFARTPDSFISSHRSFPSRVRSPTPANTEMPPWASPGARATAPTCRPRHTPVPRGSIPEPLQDDAGLAHAGAAEEARLAPLVVGQDRDHHGAVPEYRPG